LTINNDSGVRSSPGRGSVSGGDSVFSLLIQSFGFYLANIAD